MSYGPSDNGKDENIQKSGLSPGASFKGRAQRPAHHASTGPSMTAFFDPGKSHPELVSGSHRTS